MQRSPRVLGLSERVLQLLIPLNLLAGALIAVLLVASLVAERWTMTALGVQDVDLQGGLILGMRAIMLVGIGSVPLTHVVLTRLRAIVATVGAGDPFVAANARRLETIAWGVLGLELLHLVVGALAESVSSRAQAVDLDWSFSITRWLAALLLFVLARVFEHGTRLRADLDGTV